MFFFGPCPFLGHLCVQFFGGASWMKKTKTCRSYDESRGVLPEFLLWLAPEVSQPYSPMVWIFRHPKILKDPLFTRLFVR